MNFEVKVHQDLTEEELKSFLALQRTKLDTPDARQNYYCLMVVVMSHGDKV